MTIKKRLRKRTRVNSSFEVLERRQLLTNNIVLDFTPDTIANEYTVGKFADIFAAANVNASNKFLDYNGDAKIDAADAQLASKRISSRVTRLLKPFMDDPEIDLVVYNTTDLTSTADPGVGERQLAKGLASPTDSTYVIYVGNLKPAATLSRFGVAQQPTSGFNFEHYGYVFAGEMSNYMKAGDFQWKPLSDLAPIDFTNQVAFGIAHELGHLWGLGHLRTLESTLNATISPPQYHHLMNMANYANPALARFLADTTHEMEIGNPNGSIQWLHANAQAEVRNSLRTENGAYVQESYPGPNDPPLATYLQSNGPGSELGGVRAAPAPATSVPPSQIGQAGGISVATIASGITSGFQTLRGQHAADFESQLNLPAGSLPLLTTSLGGLLDLETLLQNSIPSWNVSSATTLAQLTQQLSAAGFAINYALTDAQFAALPADQPADFVRVSRTYRLPDTLKRTPVTSEGLGALGDLPGVNFTGELAVEAELYFTVSFGVDSAGFYMVPGNGVEARLAVGGNLTAPIGAGSAKASASLGFDARIVQTTSASDGRIRLADLAEFEDFTTTELNGSAGVNVEVNMPVKGSGTLSFGGDWIWDLAPDASGFVYDAVNSGFDTESLLNSLADVVGEGINRLSAQAEDMLAQVEKIELVGEELATMLEPMIQDKLNYTNELGSVRAYLAERGFQILSHVGPQDFINGSYLTTDLIRLQYQQTAERDQPLVINTAGKVTFENAGATDVEFTLSGQVRVDPALTFTMQFGLDAIKGPFVIEGASIVGSLPIEIPVANPLTGTLSIGNLVDVNASINGTIQASAGYTLTDSDAIQDEKYYLRELNLLIENDKNEQNGNLELSSTSQAAFDFNLSLGVDSPSSLPEVLQTILTDDFNWQAHATYQWPADEGTYELVSYPSFPNIDALVRQRFFAQLDQYNPLPKELREFLGRDLPIFEKPLLEILGGSAGAKLFLDSDNYQGENVDEPEDEDGEYVKINYDFASVSSVVALLMGQAANLISFDIRQIFASHEFSYTVLPRTTVFSYMGVVNGSVSVDVIAGFEFGIDILVGLDTNGFYLKDDERLGVFLSGTLGARPRFTVALGEEEIGVDFAEVTGLVGLKVTGAIDTRIPEDELATHGDGKIRGNDLYRNGSLNGDFAELSLVLDFVWNLEGRVFIEGTDFEANTKTYADSRELYRYEVGLSELTSENFSDLSDEMRDKIDGFRLCGPIGATEFAHLCPREIMLDPEDIKQRIDRDAKVVKEAIVKGASKAKKAIGETVAKAKDKLEDLYNTLQKGLPFSAAVRDVEEYLRNPQKVVKSLKSVFDKMPKLSTPTLADPLGISNLFLTDDNPSAWASTAVAPDYRTTYATEIIDDALYITWFENHGYNLFRQQDDLAATLRVDYASGKFIVDAVDYVDYVLVAMHMSREGAITNLFDYVLYPNRVEIDAQGINRIFIRGSSRNDTLIAATNLTVPVSIFGLEGNDYIQGTSYGDYLVGGSGNDVLLGRAGGDILIGDEGDDFLVGDYGDDFLQGGAGNDTLDEESIDDYDHSLSSPPSRTAEINSLEGASGDDLLLGSPGNDTMDGGRGKDTLYGNSGLDGMRGGPDQLGVAYVVADESDYIDGGNDRDVIYGGIGHDVIYGGAGNDEIHGGAGDDTVYGDRENLLIIGVDELHGDDGDDVLHGGGGDDFIYGGLGADYLYGSDGNDLLVGARINDEEAVGDGNDALYGGDGIDTMSGGPSGPTLRRYKGLSNSLSYDLLIGGAGNDIMSGGSGPDVMDGGRGGDEISGNGGDDYLTSGAGPEAHENSSKQDVLRGGDGVDRLVGGNGIQFILGVATAVGTRLEGGAGDDQLFGGSEHRDVMLGGAGSDLLYGFGGNDQMFGHGDAAVSDDNATDRLYGGAGEDELNGDGGDDFLYGEFQNDTLFGGTGIDLLHGNDGDDTLHGGAGGDTLIGHAGDDLLIGNAGSDYLYGGSGNDLAYGHAPNEADDDGAQDYLFGEDDDDTLLGQLGNDEIDGGAGRDSIIAGGGNDTVFGGLNDDVIHAGAGIDIVQGNEGHDWIDAGDGDDQVDGGSGSDRIYGGAGVDTLGGGADDDALFGGDGDDQLRGGDGDDQLSGDAGRDNLYGEAGHDRLLPGLGGGGELRGGDGNDTILGTDQGALIVTDFFAAGFLGDKIYGGSGDDTIFGLGGADYIDGGDGDDRIDSGSGSDYVLGGVGNDWLFAGYDLGDTILGGTGNDEIYGSHTGDDSLYGNDGNDRIFGQGGHDLLQGDAGHDYLDGGADADIVRGGEGDDQVYGGGGAGDQLFGDQGDDTLYGSDDGADIISAGSGQDVVWGHGGNDTLYGDAGNDLLYGGDGDDTIEGGLGSDTSLGQANHDLLYGHNPTGTNDDNAVDYLYGDFGSNQIVIGAGRDQLFGGAGNDVLFGESDDDLIVAGLGGSDIVDYGFGEGMNPTDFVMPDPTAAPQLVLGTPLQLARASLPNRSAPIGRWANAFGSAVATGISGLATSGSQVAVAVHNDTSYLAWTDTRYGNAEVYVAYLDAQGWHSLGGSAEQGGLSNSITTSHRPSITIGVDGQPIVAWQEDSASGSDIHVLRWDPTASSGHGAWSSLANSHSATGISNTNKATSPQIVLTSSGPEVAWLDTTSGISQLRLLRFDGSAWSELDGSASGNGISNATVAVTEFSLATQANKTAVAWTTTVAGKSRFYVREFNGTTWSELAGSASGTGIAATATANSSPSVAYWNGELFVAWSQSDTSLLAPGQEVYVARYSSGNWTDAGIGSRTSGGVSNSQGRAALPKLASSGTQLQLAWAHDDGENSTGNSVKIFTKRWLSDSFAEMMMGDASGDGIGTAQQLPTSLSTAIASDGRTRIAWDALNPAGSGVYLRVDQLSLDTVHIARNQNGQRMQDILDTQTLGPGDVIYISESINQNIFITAADAGVTIIGAAGTSLQGNILIDGSANVTLQHLNVTATVTVNNATAITIRDSVLANLRLDGGSQNRVSDTNIGQLQLVGANNATTLEGNSIATLHVEAGSGLAIRHNTVTSLVLAQPASADIANNTITSLDIAAPLAGSIHDNLIGGGAVGIQYRAAATLSGNIIRGSQTGIIVDTLATSGLGFVGTAQPNVIEGNGVGIHVATGRVQSQIIRGNQVGVTGAGIFGGDSIATANVLQENQIGADFDGTLQFNRFLNNALQIRAQDRQLIVHNHLSSSAASAAILVDNVDRVQIINNSIYSQGDSIVIRSGSSETEVRGNILWSDSGYAIWLDLASQRGFFSDYNALYHGPSGKLVRYDVRDFIDILDWQVELNQFDLNSNGSTVIDPQAAKPQLIDRHAGDMRVWDQAAGLQHTSPTIGRNDPRSDLSLIQPFVNLLNNPSFENGSAGWVTDPSANIATGSLAFTGSRYLETADVILDRASQVVDLVTAGYSAAELDSQDLSLIFSGRVRSESPGTHTKRIELTFFNATGAEISRAISSASTTSDRWELLGNREQIPVGTRSVRYEFIATQSSVSQSSAYLDMAAIRILPRTYAPNVGAEVDTTANPAPVVQTSIALRWPDFYVDWVRDRPQDIRWETIGNSTHAPVKIDLYQDGLHGPELVLNITASTPDDGQFSWTPADIGVNYGTLGLRLQVSLVGLPQVMDRTVESFSVPENTNTYFINDRSTSNDEYATATGDNRQTGRTAATPKPSPVSLLRIYTISPTQTVLIDNGNYFMHQPLVISGAGARGDDEGFTLSGPIANSRNVTFQLANSQLAAPMIELDDADSMVLQHIDLVGGTVGLLVRNDSIDLNATDLAVRGQTGDGVRIETGSTGARFDGLRVTDAGGDGIDVSNQIHEIRNGLFANNGGTGIYLVNPESVVIQGNAVRENSGDGIYLSDTASSTSRIGNSDLTLGLGNIVELNAGHGIVSSGSVLVAGNAVSGHRGYEVVGILNYGGVVSQNVVYDNQKGIQSDNATVIGNRAYGNSIGVFLTGFQGDVLRNTIYSNEIGIQSVGYIGTRQGYQGTIANNLVYDHTLFGLQLPTIQAGVAIVNNTVYEPSAVGLSLSGYAASVLLRNNIFVVGAKAAIAVSTDSQANLNSDYNLFYRAGGGAIGQWQNGLRTTLDGWNAATGQDRHSLSADPLFVDVDGLDGVLGYSSTSDGGDDQFHLKSMHGALVSGGMSPVVNQTTGLPVSLNVVVANSTVSSPGLDRGDASYAFALEPSPNGNYINLGAYGNTEQASFSPAEYITILSPRGGETWPLLRTFEITWRSHDSLGTVDIELVQNQSGNLVTILTVAEDTGNDGEFVWTIPAEIAPGNYSLRITRENPTLNYVTAEFVIRPAIAAYYVNVESDSDLLDNQYTTAAGSASNDGLSPETPVDSLQTLLSRGIVFRPGDTVLMDHGIYLITNNIVLTSAHTGLTIQGPTEAGKTAIFNRDNDTAGSYVFELVDAPDITLANLGITGAYTGVFVSLESNSDRLVVRDSEIFGNLDVGISLDFYEPTLSEFAQITGNSIHDNETGIRARGRGTVISGNRIYGNVAAIEASNALNLNSVPAPTPPDRMLIAENYIFNNQRGIAVSGLVDAVANQVMGQTTYGISVGGGATARNNVVFDNQHGIEVAFGSVSDNRVFANNRGIVLSYSGEVFGNRVYANSIGIDVDVEGGFDGHVFDNVLYDQSSIGIRSTDGALIRFNTLRESTATAIEVSSGAQRTRIHNNIISVASGIAIDVAADSQQSTSSDWNLIEVTGSGSTGRYGQVVASTIEQWRFVSPLDAHSLQTDPQWIDVNGADDDSGFSSQAIAAERTLNDQAASVLMTGTWRNINAANGPFLEGAGTATWKLNRNFVEGNDYTLSAAVTGPFYPELDDTGNYLFDAAVGSSSDAFDFTTGSAITGVSATASSTFNSDVSLQLGGDPMIIQNAVISINGVDQTFTASDATLTGDLRNDSYQGDYHRHPGTTIQPAVAFTESTLQSEETATFVIDQLTPGKWYQISTTWDPRSYNSQQARVQVLDGNTVVGMRVLNQREAPASFNELSQNWERLGFFQAQSTSMSVRFSGAFEESVVIDAVHVRPIQGDAGADDNFQLSSTSKAIDRADPDVYYFNESRPNGSRANLGAAGSTSLAATSAPQSIQLTSPVATSRATAGQAWAIQWNSDGLTENYTALRMNVGGLTSQGWLAENFRSPDANVLPYTLDFIPDVTGVTFPAHPSVYQSGLYYDIKFDLPIPDGVYNVRLHFMEPEANATIDTRRFDVLVAGNTVLEDVNPFEETGGVRRPFTKEFTFTATGGTGLPLHLIDQAILSGIELTQANPLGVSDPRFSIDFSADAGLTWNTVATNLPVDRFGAGRYDWNIPANLVTDGRLAMLRISSPDAALSPSVSSDRFMITTTSNVFYVNTSIDSSLTDNQYTTAAGNNFNSGRSPDRPMADLAALLRIYDLGAGDIVYVEAGNYLLSQNIVISADDAGVTIQGPTTTDKVAHFDRGNASNGTSVFELQNADNVTIRNLSISGADTGINIPFESGSSGVVIANNRVFHNQSAGIDLGFYQLSNADAQILNNIVEDTFGAFGVGIRAKGLRTIVSGNTVSDNTTGIEAIYSLPFNSSTLPSADWLVVSNNNVFQNQTGIYQQGGVISENNQVHSQLSNGHGVGIVLGEYTVARHNRVYNNDVGISASTATVESNRLYNNATGVRITYSQTTVVGNDIYSNQVGIDVASGGNNPIVNNRIFDQTAVGILVSGASEGTAAQISSNTIYEPVAIGIQSYGAALTLTGNVIVVASQVTLDMVDKTTRGAVSDYNLFHRIGGGELFRFAGQPINNLVTWQHEFDLDWHSLSTDPQLEDVDGADNKLGYVTTTQVDHSLDNNWRLKAGSPAVDAANPAAPFNLEPAPHGSRANLGSYGNTSLATISPALQIQVLAPHATERLQAGRTITIAWQSVLPPSTPAPTHVVEWSTNGTVWNVIASNATVNTQGRGQVTWTVPELAVASGFVGQIRVRSGATAGLATGLMFAPAGNSFYINPAGDANLTDNQYTTAVGAILNHGKAPGQPMSSLAALLHVYDVGPGDTIYIDAGSYKLLDDVWLSQNHSGVTLQGPTLANRQAILDRHHQPSLTAGELQNAKVGTVIELRAANDVTINNLGMTGGRNGVAIPLALPSHGLQVTSSQVFSNREYGLSIEAGDGIQVTGSTITDQPTGVSIYSTNSLLSSNEIAGGLLGIYSYAANLQIINNRIHDNDQGISAARATISGNRVFDNRLIGIAVSDRDVTVVDNTIYGNAVGIIGTSESIIANNRVFANVTGISLYNGAVRNNQIYSNSVGILADGFDSKIESNLIYANTDYAIESKAADRLTITHNTIDHAVGDAIRLHTNSKAVSLFNNIVSSQAGVAVYVVEGSQTDLLASDNLYNLGSTSSVGHFGGTLRTTIAAWRAASNQDLNSSVGDPLFVDRNGADNILGYNSTSAIDGGADDNFFLTKLSPAIDRGAILLPTDFYGLFRVDDPGTANAPGLVADLGAIEFGGSSLDTIAPTVIETMWRLVDDQPELLVQFSEAVNPIDVNASKNFELLQAGNNGILGDADDVTIVLVPYLQPTPSSVMLRLPNAGALPTGLYRLIVHGDTTIHDLSGLKLDGDADGTPGGNYTVTNRSPELAPIADQSIVEGVNWQLPLTATDADGDSLTYHLIGSVPVGLTLHTTSGLLTWQPGESQAPGQYSVTVEVRDSGSPVLIAQRSFTITTIEFNDPPQWTTLTDRTAQDGNLLTFALTAVDPEGDAVHYALGNGAPAGATLNPVTGQFQWTPNEAQSPGVYTIQVIATDNRTPAAASQSSFTISVSERNDAPVIVPLANRTVAEHNSLSFGVVGSDPELGTLTYALIGTVPSGATINSSTGVFLWTPGESHGGQSFVVTIQASDNATPSLSSTTSVTITVDELNATPVIQPVSDRTITVGQTLTQTLVATDADLPANTITFTLGEDAPAGVALNPVTGELTWTPVANQVGIHNIVIMAIDNGAPRLAGFRSLLVNVIAVNQAPTDVLLSNNQVVENLSPGSTVGSLSTVDPDAGNTFEYSLVSGAGNADNNLFTLDVGGNLRTATAINFEAKSSYSIRVRTVDQGGLAFEKAISIAVIDLPEMIGEPVFGDGTSQRSLINQIVLTFDSLVDLQPGAFVLQKRGGGTVTHIATQVINGSGQSVVTLTFSGSLTRGTGALVDGYYQLTIDGTKILRGTQALDINADGVMGDTRVLGATEADQYFALYGDTNGDGLVGVAEFGQFRTAFGKTSSQAGYNQLFDYDLDLTVGVSDFGQFRARFGKPKIAF